MKNNTFFDSKKQPKRQQAITKLPSFQHYLDRSKNLESSDAARSADDANLCRVCGGSLDNHSEYNQAIHVCPGCLRIYAAVENVLNEHADTRAREARLQSSTRKFGGAR